MSTQLQSYFVQNKCHTDSALSQNLTFEVPRILIQPEPIFDCTMGGYVTISPLVRGTNLTYSWQIIYPDSYVEVLANERFPRLTLGPINKNHLMFKYRMVATDPYGNYVCTNTSSLQLNEPRRTKVLEPVKLDSHPISPVLLPERDIFKDIQYQFRNELSPTLNTTVTSIEDMFGDISSEREKLRGFVKEASVSLDQLNSKENSKNPNKRFYLPVFLAQPNNSQLCYGQELLIDCRVSKASSYAWYFNTEPLKGVNSNTLRIPNVSKVNEGTYSCVARNEYGTVVSESVYVSVLN